TSANPTLLDYASLFLFTATATTEIYTLSLHDALPISLIAVAYLRVFKIHDPFRPLRELVQRPDEDSRLLAKIQVFDRSGPKHGRSEEHTSELQSRGHLVCRLLLEKKKTTKPDMNVSTP